MSYFIGGAMIGSAALGAGASIYSANKAGGQVADAGMAAAQINDRLARDVLGVNLMAGIPGYAAGNTALAGMMDMMGLDRSLIPTSGGDYGSGGAGGPDAGYARPYPPPPNWWQRTPEEWHKAVDNWYADPKGWAAKHPDAGRYISSSVNDYYQGMQENMWGDNVATLIDPATGLPKPYGVGLGGGFDTGQLQAAADIVGTAPKYDWQTSPGYEWRLSQGVAALDQSAAAGGGLFSGAQGKALTQWGQDYGSAEFDKIFNRLGMLAGFNVTGSSAISGGAGQYGQIGQGTGEAIYGAGASRASATLAGGNAAANAFGQGALALGWLAGNRPSGGGGGVDYIVPGVNAPAIPARMPT